ncbi:hypothetical protein [Pseudomonas matsuisoli]|uniref:Uncharacterized protein n=1 Tax=Pseudomonas matsuisoli TaxID=1515666 RepID=A0A917PZY6_9PSED|nr:hypothetical protein [Pseudomonas matsuisoli]GGK02754.1 hypothetical protein GCM10009304_30730 [Pseudomonas matsuisoli]
MKRIGKALLLGAAFTFTYASTTMLSAHASTTPAATLVSNSASQSLLPTGLAADLGMPRAQGNVFASASETLPADATHVAIFVSGCNDPAPWYMFSGIEAATCLFSGQW